ncbi:MAG: asparagine synthase C-terminal domain-containing protein [Candidatus Acidifodinimicrobium sp.]
MEELKTGLINKEGLNQKFGRFLFVFPGNSNINLDKVTSIHSLLFPSLLVKNLKEGMKEVLYQSIEKVDAVLLSGGIDSSLVAKIEHDKNKDVKFISCGLKGSEDLVYSNILAEQLGADIISVFLDEDNVLSSVKSLKDLGFGGYDLILGVVEYLCLKKMKQENLQTALTGMGSDELMFGYHKYKYLERDELIDYRSDRVYYLNATDGFRINKLAKTFNVRVDSPYLTDKFVSLAMSYNHDKNEKEVFNKNILRSIADDIGIDRRIVYREKKAMQYGSGVVSILRSISKMRGFKGINELVNAL